MLNLCVFHYYILLENQEDTSLKDELSFLSYMLSRWLMPEVTNENYYDNEMDISNDNIFRCKNKNINGN